MAQFRSLFSTGNYRTTRIIKAKQFVSNIPTGTAPFSFGSLTKINNLNAERVDNIFIRNNVNAFEWSTDGSTWSTLGYTGSSSSSTGYMGSIGYRGSAGAAVVGYRGSVGPTGYTGSIGYSGSVSSTRGSTGTTGGTGPVGYTGSAGGNGSLGITGPGGATGDVGDQGGAGATGDTGPNGADGAWISPGTDTVGYSEIYSNTGSTSGTIAGSGEVIYSFGSSFLFHPNIYVANTSTYVQAANSSSSGTIGRIGLYNSGSSASYYLGWNRVYE